MAASRTGVSTLRQLCKAFTRLIQNYPGVLLNPAVPEEIGIALGALLAACIASTFDDPGAGEITGQGVIP
jgi:hypothetical protein